MTITPTAPAPVKADRPRPTTTTTTTGLTQAIGQRRRWGRFAALTAVTAVCGLGAGYLASQGGKTESIVTVKAPILAGAPLTSAQLATTQIQVGTNLDTIPATDLTSLTGKYSTTNLPAGSILTRQMIQNTLTPATGKAVVGVALKHGQIPARGLQPGDRIRVVVTSAANGANNANAGKTWPAQVVTVEQATTSADTTRAGQPRDDGATTYDVLVDDDQAAALAAAAGGGNVAAVLEPVVAK